MKHFFVKTYRYILTLVLLASMTGCTDIVSTILGDDGMQEGEKIQFTTMVPDAIATSRSAYSDWKAKVDAYKPVNREYTFNIEMYRKGKAEMLGSALYEPDASNLVADAPLTSYDGTLHPSEGITPLYWQDNVSEWGFKATTVSSESIEADQSDQTKWLRQDKLEGYSYLPVWEGEVDGDGHGKDNFNKINYRTSKQWYHDNMTAQQLSGLMVEGEDKECFKKVPLYMQHKRSWITIILKAGDGVSRDQLAYENSENTINTTIYSYDADSKSFGITGTWRNKATVDYANDKNGPEAIGASTTRYDAIVEPYSYYGEKDGNNIIASIDLSNQKFTFAAANDFEYENARHGTAASVAHMNGYNLEPGKHLTITATLSRASRIVLITAWVEDWTETVTTTVCDDYGQKGDPVIIPSKEKLIEFLSGEKNKAGYVGIISANELDLDLDGPWETKYDLNATLNIAGAKLQTTRRLFKYISVSGSIINGTIEVKDGVTVDETIAETNKGTIEHIVLKTTSENSTSKATVAGLVKNNHGTIYQCSSNLRVEGMTGFVGGIAAISDYADQARNIMPVIDKCTVNARIDGADGVKGGGIVGSANGRVSNCTFEYGITLLQSLKSTGQGSGSEKAFNNIFQTAANETKAYNNSWPTKATNPVPGNDPGADQLNENIYERKYDHVIDRQSELAELLKSGYNIEDKDYRLSADFTVTNDGTDGWNYGKKSDVVTAFDNNGNIRFNLYGNGKTITLDGTKTIERKYGTEEQTAVTAPMLFSNIMGKIYDLTIDLKQNIVSEPTKGDNGAYNAEDAIAPLAYSLYGAKALLSNVRVVSSTGKYVESSTPAGLVVWALNHAVIENCVVDVPVKMWMPSQVGTQSKHYAGGIVACAAKATILQSQYQNQLTNSTPSAAPEGNFYYGGIVGGTVTKLVDGNSETPSLVLKDNSSWYDTDGNTNPARGAIIGYAAYAETDGTSTVKNGMAEGNEGNWWNLSCRGAGTVAATTTEAKAIGKRNSVTPGKR